MKVCKYCGQEITEKNHYKACPECRSYFKLPLYKKLGLETGSLKSRYEKALTILKDLYFVQRLSSLEIWKKTGVNFRTMRDLFQENGLHTRNLSEGTKTALLEGRLHLGSCPKYKHGWHTTWEGIQVYYRSSYELEFAKKLDSERIPYKVEFLKIHYWDSVEKKERIAIPDFFLPETNEIVEVKSSYTYKKQEMKDKFETYSRLGYKPKLLLGNQFVTL